MYPMFVGLMMLVTVQAIQMSPIPMAGGLFKPLVECKDRELGVLMTLSQMINPDGLATTLFRITSRGASGPKFFNRPDDHDEQQLRKIFSMVCLRILSDPTILDDGGIE